MRRVARALPVREIPIEDGSINVEMDPEDNFRAVESLGNAKLKCAPHVMMTRHFIGCCPVGDTLLARSSSMLRALSLHADDVAMYALHCIYTSCLLPCMIGSQNCTIRNIGRCQYDIC